MRTNKKQVKALRKARVRAKVIGSAARPRLSVFRSTNNIYVQLIDDAAGKTLASASSKEITSKSNKVDLAAEVGKLAAKKAQEAGITEVVFDRGGNRYHGRIKSLADAAREAGLKF